MKKVVHRIGYCTNCGWVHDKIQRVRVGEGDVSVVKPLCDKCVNHFKHQVICNLCGRTDCDNLYPVTIVRKTVNAWQSCSLFLHLCAECRKIPHHEILKRLKLPDGICETCEERFVCFTTKSNLPIPQSIPTSGILQGIRTVFQKSR